MIKSTEIHVKESPEAAFRLRVAELGGIVLESKWLGHRNYHQVRCPAGHLAKARPNSVQQGGGICGICSGRSVEGAEAKFQAGLANLGATLLETGWLGSGVPHRIRCAQGHEVTTRPNQVRNRNSCCRICSRRSPAAAAQEFRDRLAELGAVLLEPEWLGNGRPHQVRCAFGHECSPRPDAVQRGQGICQTCAGRDTYAAEAWFRSQLAAAGATLLERKWLGARVRHRVRCAAGHVSTPMPNGVQQGHGVCRYCAGKTWDAFYVVADEEAALLKFGITTGTGKRRLAEHRRAGFTTVHRFLAELADGVALNLERDVRATLLLAGEGSARGREYFPDLVTALVLDIVDNYPGVPRRD
ncbi:hypothetical protein ABZ650_20550 [Streptomyces griseoviridis]|uniref:hypothetical protein n=1 Tax=Streptomyces griseoviridis TaxID=45398 RepID=UPI0033F71BF5